jgi:hypothetical protein
MEQIKLRADILEYILHIKPETKISTIESVSLQSHVYYIVECKIRVPDRSMTTYYEKEISQTCRIDRYEFVKWIKMKNSVEWI